MNALQIRPPAAAIPTLLQENIGEVKKLVGRSLMMSCQTDREDAFQEVLLQIMEHHHKYDGTTLLSTWITNYGRYAVLDYMSKAKSLPQSDFEVGSCEPTYLKTEVVDLLEREPDEEVKTMIRLRFWEGKTLREIAEVLDMSISNVDVRLKSWLRSKKKEFSNE